ncbi:MAG: hypothetical protein RIE24_04460 [Silicimonas sp.]
MVRAGPPPPQLYRTRNWPTYNVALKRRGLLTIWFDPEMSWDRGLVEDSTMWCSS